MVEQIYSEACQQHSLSLNSDPRSDQLQWGVNWGLNSEGWGQSWLDEDEIIHGRVCVGEDGPIHTGSETKGYTGTVFVTYEIKGSAGAALGEWLEVQVVFTKYNIHMWWLQPFGVGWSSREAIMLGQWQGDNGSEVWYYLGEQGSGPGAAGGG